MAQAWRIVKEKYAATAFTGEGAARVGGRWNSRGTRVVYVSSSRSLAALETLVHLNPPMPFRYVTIRLEFDAALAEKFPVTELPVEWREEPPPPATQKIGDTWIKAARSAVLELPSVIIPGEANYLLNPLHGDYAKLVIGATEPFAFDPRLIA
jgi:RES domain-containing protein